jgi:hypothetical protein
MIYGGVQVEHYSRRRLLIRVSGQKKAEPHCIGGWVGPSADLWRRKKCSLLPGIEPQRPGISTELPRLMVNFKFFF